MEKLLQQLIMEAKAHNPDSEAVALFEGLMRNMRIDIDSKMQDIDCRGNTTVFENNDNPEILIDVHNALAKGDLLAARQLGLIKNTDTSNQLFSQLNIVFTGRKDYEISNEEELHFTINYDDVEIDEFDERTIDIVVQDALSCRVDKELLPHLKDQTAKAEDVVVYTCESDGLVFVELTGYKVEMKAVVQHALNKGIFTLSDDWKAGL